MNEQKLSGALGLCRRAGKITVGIDPVRESIRKGKAALVILARDLGENSTKKVLPLAEARGIRAVRVDLGKESLAAALGKEGAVGVLAVPQEFLNLVLASL